MAVDTEDAKFQPHEVWQATWFKLERKILAKKEAVRTDMLRADSRGDPPPDVTNQSRCMAPIAEFTDDGDLRWAEEIVAELKKLATPPVPKRRTIARP